MGLLVMTVSINAVITVCLTLHVTNNRDSASEDVSRDIPAVTVVKVTRVVIFSFYYPYKETNVEIAKQYNLLALVVVQQ